MIKFVLQLGLLAAVVAGAFHLLQPELGKHQDPNSEVLVSARHARSLWEAGGAVLVDARTAEMYAREHLEGAISLPLASFEAALPRLGPELKGRVSITYCDDSRCAKAERLARKLRARGHRAFVLDGGLSAWTRQDLPTVRAGSVSSRIPARST